MRIFKYKSFDIGVLSNLYLDKHDNNRSGSGQNFARRYTKEYKI